MNGVQPHQAIGGIATGNSLPRRAGPHYDRGGETRVLIVALDAVIPADVPGANVLIVAQALNSRLRHWLSDEDAARRRAGERVAAFVNWLERMGVQAEGRVGDADPLVAIADALRTFPADEIVIAGQPESSSRLADELVSHARDRFALPVFRTGESLVRAA